DDPPEPGAIPARPGELRRIARVPGACPGIGMGRAAALAAALLALAPAGCSRPAGPPPDVVLLGGRVYTVEPDHAWAEAVAVRGDRIVGVGSNPEIRALA